MYRLVVSVLAVLAVSASLVFAENVDREAAKEAMTKLQDQMREAQKNVSKVQAKLGLQAFRRGGEIQDEELAALNKAMVDAQGAVEAKAREKVAADTEGAAVIAGLDEIQTQMKQMKERQAELTQQLDAIRARLGLAGGRRKAEGEQSDADPEIVELQKAAMEARRALDMKVRERVAADPEGATALAELEAVEAAMQEMRAGWAGKEREKREKRPEKPKAE